MSRSSGVATLLAAVLAGPVACAPAAPQVAATPAAPASPAAAAVQAAAAPLVYPKARAMDHVDDYHGTQVPDPFRWLEADGDETRAWIEAQNRLTFAHLGGIDARAGIRRRLEQVWNYPRVTPPVRKGGQWFYRRNDGLQNQAVLLVTPDVAQPGRVLLDPNTLTADGTVALQTWAPSRDGRLLAYGLSSAGSDWVEIKVRDVASGKDLDDHLQWVKFSGISWTADHKGFFYSRYDAPQGDVFKGVNHFHKLYYHAVGTPQEQDVLIYERKDQKEWGFGGEVTEDGKYLMIQVWQGADSKNLFFYKDLKNMKGPAVEVVRDFSAEYAPLGNDGSRFYFRTDKDAPKGRIVSLDVAAPGSILKDKRTPGGVAWWPANPGMAWQTVVREGPDTLDFARLVGDRIVAHYMHDARSDVRLFGLDGKPAGRIELPAMGSAEGFTGDRDDAETFFQFSSFLYPGSVWRYDLKSGQLQPFAQPQLGVDPNGYETKQVFVPSKDGTQVPLFVAHKKGLQLDGSNPAYLFGYGGFNISMTPFFSPPVLVWMEMGGVFAMPCLRGGGEYGAAWHEAGMRDKKQNVFDDFIASAEWLVANGYTSPKKLGIGGGSNGGLLVGAALTQRPDLFGAALPAVGVMDMLRFHKFTIGWAWVPEYGTADAATDFPFLFKYSPLHNVKPGTTYPATLVTTADHDDRVVPGHSFKFAAALQRAQAGPAPVLIRVDVKAGHGAGKPTAKQIDEAADRWAFLVQHLGVRLPPAFRATAAR